MIHGWIWDIFFQPTVIRCSCKKRIRTSMLPLAPHPVDSVTKQPPKVGKALLNPQRPATKTKS